MTHGRLARWVITAVCGLALLVCTSKAHAWAVRVPEDFTTLQAALDSLEFYSGSTRFM